MELADWRRHIEYVVETEGQWVGLGNSDGHPVMDLPGLIPPLTAPEQHLVGVDAEASFVVAPGSPLLERLGAEGLGVDQAGVLQPATGDVRLLLVVRPGRRLAYPITYVVISGETAPSKLTIHAADLTTELGLWPCPSVSISWAGAEFQEFKTDASGIRYKTPHQLAWTEHATRVLDFSKRGKAVTTLRDVCQESFDAVDQAYGWTTPKFITSYAGGDDTSPEVAVTFSDDTVWDTISEPARQAGVTIRVHLWWPGDEPIVTRAGRDVLGTKTVAPDRPVLVVDIHQIDKES